MKKILSFDEWWDTRNIGFVYTTEERDLAMDAWNYRSDEVAYWIEKHADNVATQMGIKD